MLFRTGASCIAPPLWIVCCALLIVPPFLVFFSLLLSLRFSLRLPALLWVLPPPCGEMLAVPDPRTARSIRAKSQSPPDATGTAGDFPRPGPPRVLPPSARATAAKWPAGCPRSRAPTPRRPTAHRSGEPRSPAGYERPAHPASPLGKCPLTVSYSLRMFVVNTFLRSPVLKKLPFAH